jgi:DNA polymerase III subunit beta
MKITAPASAIDAAISIVAMAADKKTDTPLLIVADKGTVALSVNNPRAAISMSTTTSAITEEKGAATVSTVRFAGLLGGFGSRSIVTINTTPTAMTITCGDIRYRLPLLADPRAGLVIDPETGRIDLPAADCIKLLEVVAAAGTERGRFFISGVYLHSVDGQLVAVGMDGTKLLRVAVAAENFSDDDRLIVPTTAATLLMRLLRQTKPDRVTLRRSRSVFAASAPGFEIATGMIDSRYPDYRAVLPPAGANSATCQRAELLAALARLMAVAAGELPLVALTWTDGGPIRLFLAREPDTASDPIVAQCLGSARMALSLVQFTGLVSEFKDAALGLVTADRGLIIQQVDKYGLLMSCAWHEKEIAA